MAAAIVLGIILAVMRLSPNPVLKAVSWLFLWFFRGTPVYVQLVFWGLMSTIYKHIDLGIPFVVQFAHIRTNTFFSYFWLAVIGLTLNEAAYMAEIVRAGITSVDEGQHEAAVALGMSWSKTMTRIVLPQAMRVIIPPTGNELISMLKTTSLVTAVPYSYELYSRTRDLSIETFNPIPMLIVASAWYLLFTSILMVGQYYLERYFARGRLAQDVGSATAGPGQRGGLQSGPTARRCLMAGDMVRSEGVCKYFGALQVLKGIDLTVQRGEVMCLIGPSGSGKSTFLRCINHLEQISAGRLYVDGALVGYHERGGKLHEMHPRDAAQQRRDIGMVFQRFNLFPHKTALQNIIEAPTQVKVLKQDARPRRAARSCWRGLAWPTRPTPIRPSSPAVSSSGSRSPGRWPWTRS